MTDRIKGLVVTLDDDYRDDDIEPVINAIRMLRGVLDVRPLVADVSDHVARVRVRHELQDKLWKALTNEGAE